MRHILLLLTLLLAMTCKAQLKIADRYKYTAPMMFVAGVADGLNETLTHHYSSFEKRHPNADHGYWNPQESWKVKYDRNLPGVGVMFTDAYHLTRAIDRTLTVGAIPVYYTENKNREQEWWWYAIDFVVLSAVRQAGFHLTYSVIY